MFALRATGERVSKKPVARKDVPPFVFERENVKPLVNPKPTRNASEIRRLRTVSRSSFCVLTGPWGDYLQAGGSGGGMFLEKRLNEGRHFRAFQQPSVVDFDDGTRLSIGRGELKLRRNEWFKRVQVIEIMTAFLMGEPEPDYVLWRDITDQLDDRPDPNAS